jgi:hypothetical protein
VETVAAPSYSPDGSGGATRLAVFHRSGPGGSFAVQKEPSMQLKRCANGCGRLGGPVATLYVAWFNGEAKRVCWRTYLCAQCLRETLQSALAAALQDSMDVTVCPACGTDSSTDLDPIYLTVYLPKQERREYALATCGACAAHLRVRLQKGAVLMEDRQLSSLGAPSLSPQDWGLPE